MENCRARRISGTCAAAGSTGTRAAVTPSRMRMALFNIVPPICFSLSLHAPELDRACFDRPEDHRLDQKADYDHRQEPGEDTRGVQFRARGEDVPAQPTRAG